MTPPARILRVFEGHGTVNDVDGRVLVEYAFSWCGEIYSELRGRLANRAACQVYLSSLHSLLARSHCPTSRDFSGSLHSHVSLDTGITRAAFGQHYSDDQERAYK